MDNEKVDTLLNLSLDADEENRQKSEVLSSGFDDTSKTWEVVVKYHGDISQLEVEQKDILLNGYAIMRVMREQLEQLVLQEQIEFVEMPQRMQFNTYRAKQASCILPVSTGGMQLRGRGVLIACIDSGIDYLLRDFQDENGSRILYLWDQSLDEEYTKNELDRAIAVAYADGESMNYQRAREIVPSVDVSGHGTAVAGIAAGSSLSPLYQGVAPGSELIIVKLGNEQLTTDLMRGITYAIRKAEEIGRPIVINISIGDTYGSHDGTTLLERYIDSVSENGRNVICIGAGNEAVSNGHASFLPVTESRIEMSVANRERGVGIQLWKNYSDKYELMLEAPNGARFTVNTVQRGMQVWRVENTQILIYVGTPKPFTVNEELFFDFLPVDSYVDSGIWSFIITPVGASQHVYHMFLQDSRVRNAGTRFVTPTPELTMTIPAFAKRALTVGAYDIVTNSYADFSGRDRVIGEEERLFYASNVKPDIVAPGVGVTAPVSGGGYASFSGTSFATPLVTGSVALMMEWGIVRGNDRFLYGEKVKAYLRRGAKTLNGETQYPNEKTGWGALCLSESFNRNE